MNIFIQWIANDYLSKLKCNSLKLEQEIFKEQSIFINFNLYLYFLKIYFLKMILF